MQEKTAETRKNTRAKVKKALLFLLLIADSLLVSFLLYDAFYEYVAPWRHGCRVEVYDVYGVVDEKIDVPGVCFYRGMSVWRYRALGKTDAEVIVIITHFFSSPNPDRVGLGVSDRPGPIYYVLHMVSDFYVVSGVTGDGEEYLAVTPGIAGISYSLRGKVVVLLTCDLEGMRSMVCSMLDNGAEAVLVPRTGALSYDEMMKYLRIVLEVRDPRELCSSGAFVCYKR